MEDGGSMVGRSLIKQLACCNRTTREKALRLLLKTWLPSQTCQLPDDDAKKLWKGLFYCVWHSDKPLVQAELIDRLSSLLLAVDLSLALQYFSIFFLTMRREWSGIDGLRLDKFYLLIRRFLSKSFSLLKKNSWDLVLAQRIVDVLDLSTLENLQGNGVNYHIASVFLEELKPFLPVKLQVLEVLLKPFFDAMVKLTDKVLIGKIKSGLFSVLLRMGKRLLEVKKAGEEVDSGDEVVVLGTIALIMRFSDRFYELGSSPECFQGNRKVLFALHGEFLKLEKDAASSGFEFSIPDVVDQDEEEVPILVPIANGMEVDAPQGDFGPAEVVNGKVLKKCKKDKNDSADGSKKTKKKKKKKSDASDLSHKDNPDENVASENGGNSNREQVNGESTVLLNETLISNLQKQFEKVAEESGLDDGVASIFDTPEATSAAIVSKKRKRTKSSKAKKTLQESELNDGDAEDTGVAKSGEKSTKKVRFSMKNNLVWKPHNPLPPQSLRLPPSATPRGSALKKGVPPGPIREMLPPTKRPKLKKLRKAIKGVSPSVKRLKKFKSRSA